MPLLVLAVLVLALTAGAAAHAQTLYKCVGRDGKVVYQDEKCGDDRRQSTVAPPTPPSRPVVPEATKPGGPEAPEGPGIDMETLVSVISNVENCLATVTGFGAKHGAAFQKWKDKHRAAMVRFNQDGAAQQRVRQSREYVAGVARNESAEERAYRAETCDKTVAASIDSVPPKPQ